MGHLSIGDIVRKAALVNAQEHEGKASAGSVLGKVLAENPELKKNVAEIKQLVEETVNEVNGKSYQEQKAELDKYGGLPKAEIKKEREEKRELPPLPGAQKGAVVVRFAPNPDGAIHLGNARPAVLSHEYARMYNGTFILRFDDTDPKVKIPEKQFYKWIKEDLLWLGISWDKEVVASRRLKTYHQRASELINKSAAYVDTCHPHAWRELAKKSLACPCRELTIKEQQKRWEKMLKHKYKEGSAVLRIKTDLSHPNPAVRDWPALRIVDKPQHPLNKKDKVWPLFNFASAIDDHLLGTTHILRGQEHSTNETKQRFLYDAMGWKYPHVIILGRFSLSDSILSKSQIREGIRNKTLKGWDDPKCGTLRALRRRGFQPEALRQIIIDTGVQSSDAKIAFENLASYNRKIVDPTARRFFFIANPVKISIENPPAKTAKLHMHPEKNLGDRILTFGNSVFIEKGDFEKFRGSEVRLMGLFNIMLGSKSVVTTKDNRPEIKKIHWLPDKGNLKAKVILPDADLAGLGETTLQKTKPDEVIQFERFGFCRIEKKTAKEVVVVFAHK